MKADNGRERAMNLQRRFTRLGQGRAIISEITDNCKTSTIFESAGMPMDHGLGLYTCDTGKNTCGVLCRPSHYPKSLRRLCHVPLWPAAD